MRLTIFSKKGGGQLENATCLKISNGIEIIIYDLQRKG